MYELIIANKNYSSWSLRPWVLMAELGIPFAETVLRFGDEPAWAALRARVPAGKVPVLCDGATVVWDSLAIVEYLAERHAGVWPADPMARAWARSAAAEMHSGFPALRGTCSMSVGIRVRLHSRSAALERELLRLDRLWREGLARFGGPFLAGAGFSAVDSFFAPVAFRMQTYGLSLSPESDSYAARLLGLPAMRRWYADGVAETWRDEAHDEEIRRVGEWTADLRAG